ncbi:MAG: HAMP domain-containing histidine kinase, partial [Nitrospinae bacterium]|nr:HAMP domain-containing histidine kinase [Nitrospinota bacterium]
ELLRRHALGAAPLPAGSLYGAVHNRRDASLAGLLRGAGGEDLLLVEPKKGYVIYGVVRGERIGTALTGGDPAASVAQEAFRSQGGALFSGFADNNGVAGDGWLAAPVRAGDTTVGALLLRVSPRRALEALEETAPLDPSVWIGLFSAEGRLLARQGPESTELAEGVTAHFTQMSGEAGILPLEGAFGRWRGVARGIDLAGWPTVGVAAAPVAEGKGTTILLLLTGALAVGVGGLLGFFLFHAVFRPLSAHVNQISHLSQTGLSPVEGGFPPSGLAALDDLVGDLGRGLAAHRAETEKERSSLQAYIDQLESMARVAALAGDGDGADERKSRRRVGEERSFAEAVWPRIKASLEEAVDALRTLEGASASRAVTVMEEATEQLSRGFVGMAGPPTVSSGAFTGVDLARLAYDRARRLSERAEKKGIEIVFQQSEQEPVVRGDKEGLTRMVDALLENALAYTPPEGAVTVRVEKEGEIVRLTVADTGLGIAVGEEKKIFERFRRGTAAAVTGIPGLGLGLSDAHAIALAHGARMVAASGQESGAVFTVEFPDGRGPRQPTLAVGL